MSDLYSKQKKILRVLLENDFFQGIDLIKFIESKGIKKLSAPLKTKIIDYLKEERTRYSQLKFIEVKELITKANTKPQEGAFFNDFVVQSKTYSDLALMIKPINNKDVTNNRRGDSIYILKGTPEYKSIRPEIAQRHFIYLKIKNTTNKDKVLKKLERSFKAFIKAQPKETSKEALFNRFIETYNTIK